MKLNFTTLPFTLLLVFTLSVSAADNGLTVEEKEQGWLLLFNGKDYSGWKNNNDKPIAAEIEDGAMQVFKVGGDILVYDKPFGDFILKCDVKMDTRCNSGIFLRVEDLKNPVNTGLEIQVHTSHDGKTHLHSHGALYDVKAPSTHVSNGGEKWDRFEIRCAGPELTVTINDRRVLEINLDDYAEPGKRDGDGIHKFRLDGKARAMKDFARSGYIGFQDHSRPCWYKNVKLLPLDKE